MSIYAGLDLHSNNVVIGLMGSEGQRIQQRRLPNRLANILDSLKPYKERIVKVGVEATYNWYWLVDGLQQDGYPVVLANPAGMKPYTGLKHSDDESDAFFVAELLRLNILPTGHIYEAKQRPFRDLLRRRQSLVHQRTSLLLSLKSLCARTNGQSLTQGEVKALSEANIPQVLRHPADQLIATEQVGLKAHLDKSIHRVEQAVEAVADKLPCYRQLQTLPGVGRILALTISMETGPISRFAEAGNYASYCRCVQAERESNGKRKGENNAKCGNKYLAWAYVEAAHFARRSDPGCRRFYERKQAQTNTMVATKALACKLAKAGWHVMKEDRPYDPRRVFPGLRKPVAPPTR